MGNFQLAMLVTGFLLGTAIMYIPILGLSNQEMWLPGLLGWAVGLVYVFFISRIKQPAGQSPVISMILGLYCLHLLAMVTRNIGEIINITILPLTPQIVINAILVSLAAYGVIKGIEVIGRLAFPFVITSWITGVLIILMAIPAVKINHLMPIFEHSYKLIIKESINYATFPFMETVVFLPLLKLCQNPPKAMMAGAMLAGTMLIQSFLIFILVLPPELIKTVISPTFLTISTLPSGEFIRAFLVIIWMQSGFLKISVLLYVACTQLSQTFTVNYRSIVLPLAVITVSFSAFLYHGVIDMFNFIFNSYSYYALPFQLGIPLLYVLASRKPKLKSKPG